MFSSVVFHAITNQRTISAYVLRPNLTLKIDSESQMLFLLSNCYWVVAQNTLNNFKKKTKRKDREDLQKWSGSPSGVVAYESFSLPSLKVQLKQTFNI